MAGITLRDIPEKHYEHILKVQLEQKLKKKISYSQEKTVLKIIEEHKEFSEKKKD